MTASNFGRICRATERADEVKMAKDLVAPKELKVPAILHWQKYEPVAIERYEGMTGLKVDPCGLFISETHPMLAASPDGIINTIDKLIEVKCPYSAKKKIICPTTVPYLKFVDGKLSLNEKHSYYYQIQGQLYCANKNKCDLIIFTMTDTKVIEIVRDDEFIKDMVAKLVSFYQETFKGVMVNTNFYKNYYDYVF